MRIKDLPRIERPREKLLRYGDPGRLSSPELIAILLGSGRKGENVLTLSKRVVTLLDRTRDRSTLLSSLTRIKGIGTIRAAQILSLLELGKRYSTLEGVVDILKPSDVWNDMRPLLATKKEQFYVYYLDTRNALIKKELISIGSLNASIVHPREVFEPAVRNLSAHIILCHNHPSGDQTPSDADIHITRKLAEAGKILDIEVLDHVVVSARGYTSMKQNKLF